MLTYQFPDLNICPYTKLAKRFDDKDNYICILNSDNLPLDFNSLGINLKFTGSRNRVFIIHPVQLNNFSILCHGSNSIIFIDSNFTSRQATKIVVEKDNQQLYIGKRCHFFSVFIQLEADSRKIFIGDDCMFASDVNIKNSDSHVIYDIHTKEILNEPQEMIYIGNHCWIARSVRILKNASIPNDCIVGMGAYVTKKFYKPNCVLAGIPASIVKEGVNWRK